MGWLPSDASDGLKPKGQLGAGNAYELSPLFGPCGITPIWNPTGSKWHGPNLDGFPSCRTVIPVTCSFGASHTRYYFDLDNAYATSVLANLTHARTLHLGLRTRCRGQTPSHGDEEKTNERCLLERCVALSIIDAIIELAS